MFDTKKTNAISMNFRNRNTLAESPHASDGDGTEQLETKEIIQSIGDSQAEFRSPICSSNIISVSLFLIIIY